MRKVITYGTFDLLHAGHINLLRRAKELGDYLIVVVSTDEFNWNEKQKKCYFSYEERKKLVEAVRYVDLVIPEENWDRYTCRHTSQPARFSSYCHCVAYTLQPSVAISRIGNKTIAS